MLIHTLEVSLLLFWSISESKQNVNSERIPLISTRLKCVDIVWMF